MSVPATRSRSATKFGEENTGGLVIGRFLSGRCLIMFINNTFQTAIRRNKRDRGPGQQSISTPVPERLPWSCISAIRDSIASPLVWKRAQVHNHHGGCICRTACPCLCVCVCVHTHEHSISSRLGANGSVINNSGDVRYQVACNMQSLIGSSLLTCPQVLSGHSCLSPSKLFTPLVNYGCGNRTWCILSCPNISPRI